MGGWWSNIAGSVNVGGDVVDDEDELMKYSRELEEDLESDTIEAVPGADSMNGT